MASISFHPEAASSLDTHATALLAKVGTLDAPPGPLESLVARRVPAHTLTEKEIVGPITVQGINELTGTTTELRFVSLTADDLGLDETGWKDLEALTHLAHKHLPNRNAVSVEFVKDTLITWLRKRGATDTFPTFLLHHVEQAVATRTILVPIANLYIDADFPFGPVQLRVITPALVHSWYESYRASCPPEKLADLDAMFDRLRRELQGLTAVALTIEADEAFAVAQCLELAEQAIGLLRVLHPANTSPHATLYVRPLGSENVELFKAFRYQGTTFRGRQEGIRPPNPSPWEIRSEHRQQTATQLDTLGDLLTTPDRTDFTRTLFDALLIYSRNNIAKDVYTKLIFCMIAVESMLLRDQQEPIQTHISERMAYLLGRTVEERLAIETLVKRCYDIRSRFVHGHQKPAELQTVADFMHKTWALFLNLIRRSAEFPTKAALIDLLHQHKYR
jgi:Apea-like HEPN